MLGSNPPRNTRLQTHRSDGRGAAGDTHPALPRLTPAPPPKLLLTRNRVFVALDRLTDSGDDSRVGIGDVAAFAHIDAQVEQQRRVVPLMIGVAAPADLSFGPERLPRLEDKLVSSHPICSQISGLPVEEPPLARARPAV